MTYIYRVHYKNREVAISLVKPEVSDQIEQVEELEMLLPTDYTVGENWKNEKMIFDEKGNGCKLSATNSKHVIVAESIAMRYPKRKGIRVDDRNQEVGKHQGMTIRSLREEAGLTKQDVIDASGLSSRIVYRLEEDGYDIRSIRAEKLMRLAYILDTDPMCLYEAGLPKK